MLEGFFNFLVFYTFIILKNVTNTKIHKYKDKTQYIITIQQPQ
jgi:hypothetical protein